MKIRLWKLGSLEHRIMPRPQTFQKLKDILQEASTSGRETFDLIWDPTLSVQEIEVGPDGIDVPVGDVAFSDELRGKIEQLIADHMRPSPPALEEDRDRRAVIDRLVSVFMNGLRRNAERAGVDFSLVSSVQVFEDENLQGCRRYGWYGFLDGNTPCAGSSVDIRRDAFPNGILPSEVTKRLRDEATAFVCEQKALQSSPAGQVVRQKPADLRTVAETVSEADNPVVSLNGSSVLRDVHADIAKRVMASVRCRWDGPYCGKSDVLLEPTMESIASEFAVSERVMKYSFDLSDSAKAALADYVSVGEPGLFTPGPKKCDCPAENFAANGVGCVCGGV